MQVFTTNLTDILINSLHGGGTNSAYLDGHVESHKLEYYQRNAVKDGSDDSSRLWAYYTAKM